MQANEGPWTSRSLSVSAVIQPDRQVTFDPDRASSTHSSLQNATEDAIETVRKDGIEPYRSPYICKIITDSNPQVRVIDLDTDFLSPDGTFMALPSDGPPLPDAFVLGSMDDNRDGTVTTAYFHVDTGATCVLTDQTAELHCPVPTQATCGTAAKGPCTIINAMGWLMIDFITTTGIRIPLELPNATEIQQFQRHSLSCHALQDLGYDVQHSLLMPGNLLRLRKTGSTIWHSIPLVTHGRSDYVKVDLHLPAVAGLTKFHPHQALTEQTVARLDLMNKFQSPADAHALIMLVHLRYGCASGTILVALLKSLKITVPVPADFLCPICMSEKGVSLSRGSIQPILFLPLGARLQMDFGFYKLKSIRGFTCFLVIIEARSSHRWVYLRRSKHPPIELCLWFIWISRRVLGFSVTILCTDGGGEL
jgi:hypothetical protein